MLAAPAHATYSIVARDPTTGELGVAVQSHWFSVGAVVPWAEAGVGAVATQSLVDPSYGPLGLDLMRAGKTAEQALAGLLAADKSPDIRQVAMIDAAGNVAVHTGARCIPEAGQVKGANFSCQANLMEKSTVPGAMAKAFEAASGDLATRMLAALRAAQAEGGDIRGQQSAAMLIVKAKSSGKPWEDRTLDLRVEDSNDPLGELARLLRVHQGYSRMNAGDLAIEHGDLAAAQREYGAAEELMPDNLEARYWHAVALINAKQVEAALPIFAGIFRRDEKWRTLTPRLVKAGFLTADDATLQRILQAK
jgi:uncharacterized Ntn-hydrolase superfamily protein